MTEEQRAPNLHRCVPCRVCRNQTSVDKAIPDDEQICIRCYLALPVDERDRYERLRVTPGSAIHRLLETAQPILEWMQRSNFTRHGDTYNHEAIGLTDEYSAFKEAVEDARKSLT
jgi:hypothetical protein